MTFLGFCFAVAFWLLAGWVLSDYEIEVRVLRPSTRSVYGWCALLIGLVWWFMIARLGQR